MTTLLLWLLAGYLAGGTVFLVAVIAVVGVHALVPYPSVRSLGREWVRFTVTWPRLLWIAAVSWLRGRRG